LHLQSLADGGDASGFDIQQEDDIAGRPYRLLLYVPAYVDYDNRYKSRRCIHTALQK
jgi:hypothetical protein